MDKGTGTRNKQLAVDGKWLGLTTISDATNLPLGALKEATNVVTDVGGMIRKREGFKLEKSKNSEIVIYDKFKLTPSLTKQKFYTVEANQNDIVKTETFIVEEKLQNLLKSEPKDLFDLRPPYEPTIKGKISVPRMDFVGNGLGTAYSEINGVKTALGENLERWEWVRDIDDVKNVIIPYYKGSSRVSLEAPWKGASGWKDDTLFIHRNKFRLAKTGFSDLTSSFNYANDYITSQDARFYVGNSIASFAVFGNLLEKSFIIMCTVDYSQSSGGKKIIVKISQEPINIINKNTNYSTLNIFEEWFEGDFKGVDIWGFDFEMFIPQNQVFPKLGISIFTFESYIQRSKQSASGIWTTTNVTSGTIQKMVANTYNINNANEKQKYNANAWTQVFESIGGNFGKYALPYQYFMEQSVSVAHGPSDEIFDKKKVLSGDSKNVANILFGNRLTSSKRDSLCYDVNVKENNSNTILGFFIGPMFALNDANKTIYYKNTLGFIMQIKFKRNSQSSLLIDTINWESIKSSSAFGDGIAGSILGSKNEFEQLNNIFYEENKDFFNPRLNNKISIYLNKLKLNASNNTTHETLNSRRNFNVSFLNPYEKNDANVTIAIDPNSDVEKSIDNIRNIKTSEMRNLYSALLYILTLTITNKKYDGKYHPWDWLSDFSEFNNSNKKIEVEFSVTKKSNNLLDLVVNLNELFLSNTSNFPLISHSLNNALTTETLDQSGNPSHKTFNIRNITDYTFFDNKLIINTGEDIVVVALYTNDYGQNLLFSSSLNYFSKIVSTQELFNIGHNIIDNSNQDRIVSLYEQLNDTMVSIRLKDNDISINTDKSFSVVGKWTSEKMSTHNFTEFYEVIWSMYDEKGNYVKDSGGAEIKDVVSQEADGSFKVPRTILLGGQNYSLYAKVNKIATFDASLNKVVPITKTPVLDEFGNTTIFTDFSLQNKIIKLSNAYDEIKICKFSEWMNGKLIFYGNDTNKIYTSVLNDPFYFYANNIVIADSFGLREPLVSITDFKDTKIIFTENTMMSMSGDGNYAANSPWAILGLDSTHGCPSHNAALPIENTIAFVSKDGVYIISQLSVANQRVDLTKISMSCNDLVLPLVDDFRIVNERVDKNVMAINHENRLLIYYPSKKYFMVYDYSNSEFNQGIWFKWILGNEKDGIIQPNFLKVINGILYSNHVEKVIIKYPRLAQHIYEVDFFQRDSNGNILDIVEPFYTDLNNLFDIKLVTRDTTAGEVDKFKRFKNITIITSNSKAGTADMSVKTTVDSQPDIDYKTSAIEWKNPTLGTFKLGKQMTVYRPYDNLHSKSFIKSKNGRLISISIEETSNLPFELKNLIVDVTESNAKNKQVTRTKSEKNR